MPISVSPRTTRYFHPIAEEIRGTNSAEIMARHTIKRMPKGVTIGRFATRFLLRNRAQMPTMIPLVSDLNLHRRGLGKPLDQLGRGYPF